MIVHLLVGVLWVTGVIAWVTVFSLILGFIPERKTSDLVGRIGDYGDDR